MPIPQLEKKQPKHAAAHVRSAAGMRKKRMASREERTADGSTPEQRKTGSRWKRFSRKKKIFTVIAFLGIIGLGIGTTAVAAAYVWVSKDLADISDLERRATDESTKIYARDGETLLYEVGDNRRIDTPIEQIDEHIQQATVAIEDKRFYEHSGIDIKGIFRAVFKFRGVGSAQGASTLTQQLVSNTILSKDRNVKRKLKELILAIRLEQKYSKDQILGMYMNEVYYGPNYQGVGVAAEEYFGHSAAQVSIAEAATLASLPKSPSSLPYNPDRLKTRRDYTLSIMKEEGYITAEEEEQAQAEPIVMNTKFNTPIKAAHFVFYVKDYLEEKYGQTTVNNGGLRVVTTLDWDKQQKAETAINDNIPNIEKYGGDNAALVSIDAHNGQILALVGSRGFFDNEHHGQVNVATSPNQQPGSSFKPIVYYTAFTKGYIPETRIYDLETDFPTESGVYHPHNFDGHEHGLLTLRTALDQSYNIPAVKMMYLAGKDEVINNAEKMGYTTFSDRSRFGLSMALGAGDVSLLEHTAAYATFAREGEYHRPGAILKVMDREGNTLEEWQDRAEQTLDQSAVRTLNNVLSDAAARGSIFRGLNLSDRPVAAKTGTSNEFRDAWAMGYTPSIATGVWTGRNDNAPMNYLADGIVIAAPLWREYMESILVGSPVETFNSPSYKAATEVLGGNLDTEKEYSVDSVTGEIIPDECVDTYPSAYVTKKTLKETHTILHYINREDPTGSAPEDPAKDPMYNSWEAGVQRYAESKPTEYVTDKTPRADCHMRDANQQPTVHISSLEDGETYLRRAFIISANVTPGSGRTVTTIRYLIDDFLVDTDEGETITSEKTVTSGYIPRNLTAGRHTVSVEIIDDRGNTNTDSVDVIYVRD